VPSIAKKFARRSLMLALLLCFGYLALPSSTVAQGSPEAAILEHEIGEATRVLQQRQREAERTQQQVRRQQRSAEEFEIIMVKAKAQYAMMARWHKAHPTKLQTQVRDGLHKKRLQCKSCF